jgi:hypothetical protein
LVSARAVAGNQLPVVVGEGVGVDELLVVGGGGGSSDKLHVVDYEGVDSD